MVACWGSQCGFAVGVADFGAVTDDRLGQARDCGCGQMAPPGDGAGRNPRPAVASSRCFAVVWGGLLHTFGFNPMKLDLSSWFSGRDAC